MTDFVIGCTHFGHANIINLCNRPFESVEAMDRHMIERWNAVVGPRDTVYHLGDFAFRGAPAGSYERQLNGQIVRVKGNHDPVNWGADMISVKINKTRVVLCHYPIEEWDGWWKGSVHLHCHTHKPTFMSAPRRGNVGVDAIGFEPMRLDVAVQTLLERT